jgi:conjugal transfer mating pair stabilization protein TraG
MSASDVEIITYGGGDFHWHIFNAISMLFYGKDDCSHFVQPLCVITALIGGTFGISRCFFQAPIESLFNKYIFPLLVVPYIFMVPQARLHIIDKLHSGKPFVVDHVPLLFAKIAGTISLWGYEITQAIEKVMHTPNDVQYCKTGMIFGSESALDFSRLKLNNASLAQNLHQFTQQCIIYDIALGRYTLDELRKASDILKFLETGTSKVRMIPYVDPLSKTRDFVTCLEAVAKMKPLFSKETEYYTKHEMLKKIPISYQTLMNFKRKSEESINEQMHNALLSTDKVCQDIIVTNAFDDAMSRFATERAKNNQRSMFQTGGSMAGSFLVTMRIVFEALIYALCVFILPLAMIPGGIQFIGKWIFLNIWIQLWPPLYAVLNYISMLSMQKYALYIQGGISNGFSLFTSAGFQDMANDVAALGGYLSLSVPLLSFHVLQNLQSLVHVSSSLLNPSGTAITAASSELSSGNYSYANSSMGQMSYDNQTSLQQNLAPMLASGFFTDNHGTHQLKYGSNHLTATQDPSSLNSSISTAEAYSQQLHHAQQYAQTHLETAQNLYTETHGVAERNIADFMQHASSSDAYSTGHNITETQALQESANWIVNSSESWGRQYGVSSRDSLEYFASAGLGWSILLDTKAGHSGSCSAMSDEARQSAQNIFDSQDFQKHYQNVLNSTHNESQNQMTDEGKRLVENCTASMENLVSSQSQLSQANSALNQISENLSYLESHTSTINSNLNTEFVNWLNERGELSVISNPKRQAEMNNFINEFVSERCQVDLGSLQSYQDPGSFQSSQGLDLDKNWQGLKNQIHQKAAGSGISFGEIAGQKQEIIRKYEQDKAMITANMSNQGQKLSSVHQTIKTGFDQENEKTGRDRLNMRTSENLKDITSYTNMSANHWFNSYADVD